MATNIPPHNLREIIEALLALLEGPQDRARDVDEAHQRPDFPTGGQLLNSKVELRQIYKEGAGTIRVRGEYKLEEKKKGNTDIVITSMPWAMTKADLVQKIADVIKHPEAAVPHGHPRRIDDRRPRHPRDQKDADPELVMAYLYKHTRCRRTSTST